MTDASFDAGTTVYWFEVVRHDHVRADVTVLDGRYVCTSGGASAVANRGGGVCFTNADLYAERADAVADAFGTAAFLILSQGYAEVRVVIDYTYHTLTREKLCQDPTRPPSPPSTPSTTPG